MSPEIGPAFREKEPNARLEDQWSVQEPGDFILYYYRVERSEGLLELEINVEAPEFESRPWVIRE